MNRSWRYPLRKSKGVFDKEPLFSSRKAHFITDSESGEQCHYFHTTTMTVMMSMRIRDERSGTGSATSVNPTERAKRF